MSCRRRVPRRHAGRGAAGELPRRHLRARQGRLARRPAAVAAARGARTADAARLAVDPARAPRRAPAIGMRSGMGGPPAARLLEGLHGRDAWVADAWMLDGSGRADHERRELAEIVERGAASGWPDCGARDRRPGESRGARCVRAGGAKLWQPKGLRQRIEHAQLLAPEDLPRFAELGATPVWCRCASVLPPHSPRPPVHEMPVPREWPKRLRPSSTDGWPSGRDGLQEHRQP